MSKYNHKQNITWTTYDGDDILEEVETLVAEKNAPMTFIDALEVVRSTIKYKAEEYNDCVNSTYYSFNDTSNGKVMGIYSEFEHFKSLDIDSFNSELKTLFTKFDSFYDSELEQYRTKRIDDLPTNLKNKLEKFYDDLGVLVAETIEKEFQLTMKFVDEMVKKFNKENEHYNDLDENYNGLKNMSFTNFLNGSFKGPKTTINESKIAFSNKSSFIEDVVGEVLGYCDSKFIVEMEKIAEYLKIDLDGVVDHAIETFGETIKRQKGFWQLGSVAQDVILYAIVTELENRDIDAEYDNSIPSYPLLTINGEDVKTLKEFKDVLKELDKDD